MVTCHFKKNPPENSLLKAGGFGVVGEEGRRRRWLGEEGRRRARAPQLPWWSSAKVGVEEGWKQKMERDMVRWGAAVQGCVSGVSH